MNPAMIDWFIENVWSKQEDGVKKIIHKMFDSYMDIADVCDEGVMSTDPLELANKQQTKINRIHEIVSDWLTPGA